jgi:hypothetical protein
VRKYNLVVNVAYMGEMRDAHSLVRKADMRSRLARHSQGRIILKLISETWGTKILNGGYLQTGFTFT